MSMIEEVVKNPVTLVLSFFVVLLAIEELIKIIERWKGRGDKYHEKRVEDEDFHRKVCDIACTSEEHTKTLEKIGNALEGINRRLDKMESERKSEMEKAENERKADIAANGRATLYHLYETLREKETLSLSEYETFNNVAKRYLEAGGNSVFKDKIIPEILGKPVDED